MLDTGIIESLGSEKISIDEDMPVRLKKTLQKRLEHYESVPLNRGSSDAPDVAFASKTKDGDVSLEELVAHHRRIGGDLPADFHMSQESDGTRRLMDLLPAFLEVSSASSRGVYVVDELDPASLTRC